MYMGQQQTGTHSDTFKYKRNAECRACKPPVLLSVDKKFTLKNLVEKLEKEHGMDGPSLASDTKILYSALAQKDQNTPLCDLMKVGELIRASDKQKQQKKVWVTFKE